MSTQGDKTKGKEPVDAAPTDGEKEWVDETHTNPGKSGSKRRARRGKRGSGKNKNKHAPEGMPASVFNPTAPAPAGAPSTGKSEPAGKTKPGPTTGPVSAPTKAAAVGPSKDKDESVGSPKPKPAAGPSKRKSEPVGKPKPGPVSAPTQTAAASPKARGNKPPASAPREDPPRAFVGHSGTKWHGSVAGMEKLASIYGRNNLPASMQPQPDSSKSTAAAAETPLTAPQPAPATTPAPPAVPASGAQPPVAAPAPAPAVQRDPTANAPESPATLPLHEFPAPRRGVNIGHRGQRGRGNGRGRPGRPRPKVRLAPPSYANPWGPDFFKKIQTSDKVSNMSSAREELTPEMIEEFISRGIPTAAPAPVALASSAAPAAPAAPVAPLAPAAPVTPAVPVASAAPVAPASAAPVVPAPPADSGAREEPLITVEILQAKLENMKMMAIAQDNHVRGQADTILKLKKDNTRMEYAGYDYEKKLKVLANLEEENAALREQNSDYEAELAGRQQSEEIHDAANAESRRLVEDLRQQLKARDDRIAEMEERNAGLESDLQAAKESHTSVRVEKLGMKSDLAKKDMEIENLKAGVARLHKTNKSYSERVERLQEEKEDLDKQLHDSKIPEENEALWAQLKEAREALDVVSLQLADLEAEQEPLPCDETRVPVPEGLAVPLSAELEQAEGGDEIAAPETTGEQSPTAPPATEFEQVEGADGVPAPETTEPIVQPPPDQSEEGQRPTASLDTKSEQRVEGEDNIPAAKPTEYPVVQPLPDQSDEEQRLTALLDTEFKQTERGYEIAALADEPVVQPSPDQSDEGQRSTTPLHTELEQRTAGGDEPAASEKALDESVVQPSPCQSGEEQRPSVQRASSLPIDLSRPRPTVSSATQTIEEAPAVPVETQPEERGWWRSFWLAVILMYGAYFLVEASRRDAQRVWGQANEVSRATYVDLGQPSWIPFMWAEKLGYSLIVSQQLNLGMLG